MSCPPRYLSWGARAFAGSRIGSEGEGWRESLLQGDAGHSLVSHNLGEVRGFKAGQRRREPTGDDFTTGGTPAKAGFYPKS